MELKYIKVEDMEPEVVDLTINQDFPEFSVRMPVFEANLMKDFYFELRYKKAPDGRIGYTFHLSDKLLGSLAAAKNLQDNLPLLTKEQTPFPWHIGPIDNLYTATRKLKEFNDSGVIQERFRKLPEAKRND
jgi:hypothetical protein